MNPNSFLASSKRYAQQLKKVQGKHVNVGVLSDIKHPHGSTIFQVARANEYGTSKVPRRSFLRATFHAKNKEMTKYIFKRFEGVLLGDDARQALGLIGVAAVNYIHAAFDSQGFGQWPSNAAATVAKKGSAKVLVDTGTLRNSIHSQVR